MNIHVKLLQNLSLIKSDGWLRSCDVFQYENKVKPWDDLFADELYWSTLYTP